MNNKKIVKEFINYISMSIEYNFRVKHHNGFLLNLTNDKMSYLISDKAIEIRIKNILWKEYGLMSQVTYEVKPSPNLYLDGELRVRLLT
ncbi:hypothetical protein [Clostridium sp. VAP52]|uniref:hypothetical protein n=1 Tax=Clostridium sp. VAP52 TaxID=2949977 RepID=UPI00207A0AE7|nr:hypothetical protein [Clostridium sp. VAP52]